MKFDLRSRRHFLQGMGLIVAAPLLPSLLSREARAQVVGTSPKFLSMFWDNGVQHEQWHPNKARFSGGLTEAQGYRYGKLSAISGDISENFGSEISKFREHLLILRGLDHLQLGSHNDRIFMSGQRDGGAPSLDQVLAWNTRSNPGASLSEKALNLCALPNEGASGYYRRGNKTLSYVPSSPAINGNRAPSAKGDLVLPIDDPSVAFAKIFGVTVTSSGVSQIADLKVQRRKLVDLVLSDFNRTKNGRAISSADKMQLEKHMALLSDLQTGLPTGATMTPTGSPMSCGASLMKGDFRRINQFQDAGGAGYKDSIRNMLRLQAAAFACGITNVGSLMLTDENSDDSRQFSHLRYLDANLVASGPLTHHFHELAHMGSDVDFSRHAGYRAIIRSFTENLAFFLEQVSQYNTGGGDSLLNHVLVMAGSTLSHGNRHDAVNLPVVLAGKAGGFLKTGYFVDYISADKSPDQHYFGYNDPRGRPYNELLVTILRAMNLRPQDYEATAGAGFGSYDRLGEYSRLYTGMSDAVRKNSVLPFVIA